MLYVVLLLAVVFYVSLFLLWGALGSQLGGATARFSPWRDLIVAMPDQTALLLLKEVIILTLIYIVFDSTISLVRRTLERRTPRPSWHDYPTPPHDDSLLS